MDPRESVEGTKSGAVLRVRVRARARVEGVGWTQAAGIRVAVRPAPEKGKANEAVERAVAAWLGVPPRDLKVISGATGTDKRLSVAGLGVEDLRARVRALAGGE